MLISRRKVTTENVFIHHNQLKICSRKKNTRKTFCHNYRFDHFDHLSCKWTCISWRKRNSFFRHHKFNHLFCNFCFNKFFRHHKFNHLFCIFNLLKTFFRHHRFDHLCCSFRFLLTLFAFLFHIFSHTLFAFLFHICFLTLYSILSLFFILSVWADRNNQLGIITVLSSSSSRRLPHMRPRRLESLRRKRQ